MQRGQSHQLVAVDDASGAVDREHPVAVAVEGEAHVVAAHPLGEGFDMGRAAAAVDVAPVGLGGQRVDVRTQAAEDLRRHTVGGAVRAVEQDAHAR